MLAPSEEGRKYQHRMALIFTGLLIGIPVFLFALLMALAFFFNPFGLS